jgi:hypothetical protein
VVKKQGK